MKTDQIIREAASQGMTRRSHWTTIIKGSRVLIRRKSNMYAAKIVLPHALYYKTMLNLNLVHNKYISQTTAAASLISSYM